MRRQASMGARHLKVDLLRFLRIRERTVQELAQYLRRRGHAAEDVQPALAAAQAQGFVNDRRFAEVFLRDRRRLRPMGRRAVLRELEQRGVTAAVAGEALAACDPPWDDEQLAGEALARRWARWPEAQRRARGRRFLQRRGFGAAVALRVIGRLAGGDEQPAASAGEDWLDDEGE